MLRPLLLIVLATATLSACDSGNDSFQIGGEYSGVTEDFGDGRQTSVTFDIPTTESGESFSFDATVRETAPGGSDESTLSGSGTYDHPAITITMEGETTTGTVSDDEDSFTLEIEPGDFVTFSR